jgi:hypothetical protein
MRGLIALSLWPLLASSAPTFSTETIHEGVAPLLSASNAETVPDSYIVVFKKHVTEASASAHHSWVQDAHLESENVRTELRKRGQFPLTDTIFEGMKHTYNIAGDFLGYSGHFDDSVIERVRRHPDVSSPKSLLFLLNPPPAMFVSSTTRIQRPSLALINSLPSRYSSEASYPNWLDSVLSHVIHLICPM